MANNGTVIDPSNVAATVELARMVQLLGAVLAELRGEDTQLAVSDAVQQEMTLEHWPVAGLKRVLIRRTGYGTSGVSVGTTGQLLVPPNEARLGMRWTNSGATNAAVLYLSDAARNAVPCVYLAPNGGTWEGRFGGVTWHGNVFATAAAATTTIIGGEF
jgi:hypothetical protein